ncbi:MAG: response regulator transcription factor [Akkermansiaceae bacterium]|nr:response regulator transcription factor [Akkermansiaceae bacterium]
MPVPTILVVEDDAAVRRGVVDALTYAGYEVLAASDGREGREAALTARYDLLLLDLILPHYTGFEILEALQGNRAGQAVIILSAKGEENDRIKGLKMGADDYVMKPFSARELLARVDAVLRRTTERQALGQKHEVAGRVIDLTCAEIVYDGARQELSEREVGVLRYLIANPARPVPRDELLRHVWGIDPNRIETRTVDMHIAHIRKKLGDHSQKILETVRGRGYRLAPKS